MSPAAGLPQGKAAAKSVKILARGISYCKRKEIAMISVKIKERFTVDLGRFDPKV
jgi:hypothetical protein